MEQDLTQLTVILSDGSTGCDEMDDCFAKEAGTMIYIVCDVDLIVSIPDLCLLLTLNKD